MRLYDLDAERFLPSPQDLADQVRHASAEIREKDEMIRSKDDEIERLRQELERLRGV